MHRAPYATTSLLLPLSAALLASLAPFDVGAAPAEASASGTASVSLEGSGASADADGSQQKKWIHRWAPTNHMGEVGIYGGILLPSRRLELFQADDTLPEQGFREYDRVAPDLGLRAGYYPLRFFGLEGEGGFMPTQLRGSDDKANLWTVRGHVVGQLGLWSITPFVLAGVGALGVSSPRASVGKEVDVAIHFGAGVKFYLNRWLMLRLDLRDVLSNRRGVGESVTQSFEILLGLSVTLGRPWERARERPAKADRDGDGIRDDRDKCPDVPGERPSGCPPDSDRDGLTDDKDKCPREPEARNGWEDKDGCPDEVPKQLIDVAGIMAGIQFDIDKDTIKPVSRPILERAKQVLVDNPDIHVEISGHTDSTGSRDHNMDLSRRRAEAVKKWFVAEGLDAARFETKGLGPDDPIDTNDTKEGRTKNRRIEFQILSGGSHITVEK
jgi:outer membrane protein OmpA-like peptidoglycan-associated protein